MSYMILTDSRQNKGEKLAMADRSKTKTQWWTQRPELAMVFESHSAAQIQKAKIRFNNPEVWALEKGVVRLGQIKTTVTVSTLEVALAQKDQQWHDDDWSESCSTGNGLES